MIPEFSALSPESCVPSHSYATGWRRLESPSSVLCHLFSVCCLPSEALWAKGGLLFSAICHLSSDTWHLPARRSLQSEGGTPETLNSQNLHSAEGCDIFNNNWNFTVSEPWASPCKLLKINIQVSIIPGRYRLCNMVGAPSYQNNSIAKLKIIYQVVIAVFA